MRHVPFLSLRALGSLLGYAALMAGFTTAQAAPGLSVSADAPNYAQAASIEHLLHWKRMPVTVAFMPAPALTAVREQQTLAGFDEWVRATGGEVSYSVVSSAAHADITVTLDPEATVPGQHGAAGNTAVIFVRTELKSAAIELAAGRTTPNQLQEVAAHEFGHALGIDGHSDDPGDLMAPVEMRLYDPYGAPVDAPAHAVTARDLNTLKACYGFLSVAAARPRLATQDADRDSETISPAAPPR